MSTETLQHVTCFHCGQPVYEPAKWSVKIDQQQRAMCCPGCAAVAGTIVELGLSNYYLTRTAIPDGKLILPGVLEGAKASSEVWAQENQGKAAHDAAETLEMSNSPGLDSTLYDLPTVQERFVRIDRDRPEFREATLLVEGLRCGACIWLIEQALSKIPGVTVASVNYATQQLQLRWHHQQVLLSYLLQAVAKLGYRAAPFDQQRQQRYLEQTARRLFKQLFVAGIGMMQVMMYAIPVYLASAGSMDWEYEHLMRWASFCLTIPVVFYAAQDFFIGAWSDLRRGRLGMDVPVALGVGAAFVASSLATLGQHGAVYFDSITMFVFLLLGGRYFELRARQKATAHFLTLSQSYPLAAYRMIDYPRSRTTELVAIPQLCVGDFLLIRPGETVPADVRLLEGAANLDLSLLTGESHPVHKAPQAEIPSGAVNLDQPIVVEVVRVGRDSVLSTIEYLAEKALHSRPALATQADRVAGWFVLGLLVLTGLSYLAWYPQDPAKALAVAIAMLVVSCPCALSLATPSALAASIGALMRIGVLVARGGALEKLAQITDLVVDKTGTLTSGTLAIAKVQVFSQDSPEELLRLASVLEVNSEHPIAQAFARDVLLDRPKSNPPCFASDLHNEPGQGVSGKIDGLFYRIGSQGYVQNLVGKKPPKEWSSLVEQEEGANWIALQGATPVWLGRAGEWLAVFLLTDNLRPGAEALLSGLQRRGVTVHLLSGDVPEAVHRVAELLHLPIALAQQSPQQKLGYVQKLQQQGKRVAMLGDGINDAPVLGGADVAIAMGQGAYLAQIRADIVFLGSDFARLGDGLRQARSTMRVIRQNLWWAVLYNLVAIPAAALGWVSPWLAGLGMSLSSVLVVANASRLLHVRPVPL